MKVVYCPRWNLDSRSCGSRVEILAVRDLRGRGWLVWPFFPLGLARRDVANYLRQFLAKVEATEHDERVRQVLAHPAADLAAFAKGTFGQTRHRF